MPRTSITAQRTPGSYPATPLTADAADLAFAAADAVNGNQVRATGKELLVVRNDNAGAQTVTITSAKDGKNRKGDITAYSIGAGEYAVFGPLPRDGWKQPDGYLYLDASSADIKFAIIQLP